MEILLQQFHKMGVNMCVSLCEVVGDIYSTRRATLVKKRKNS